MGAKRIERLKKVILRKASNVILYELHDPRLGFVTLSKVDLTDDLRHAVIYYSVIGTEAERSETGHALEDARGYVQKEIASALHTRVTPHVRFKFDESIEGALRIARKIDEVVAEDEEARRAREEEAGEEEDPRDPGDTP